MRIRCAFVSIGCGVDLAVKESNVVVTASSARSRRLFRRGCHFLRIAASAHRTDFTAAQTVNPDLVLLSAEISVKRSPLKVLTNYKRAIALELKRPEGEVGETRIKQIRL